MGIINHRKAIESEDDVRFLVRRFYTKVREDDLIGPVFNAHIDDWEVHLERISDFWETNLLLVSKYKGKPAQVHVEVDKATNEGITQIHFARWLQLWFETINDYFIGVKSELAKKRARQMSTHFFIKIFSHRQ